MAVTINFTATTETDVNKVKVYEATSSDGAYTFVYEEAITTSTTSVTYAAGSQDNWYRISFVDLSLNEGPLSAAIQGSGATWADYMIPLFRTEIGDWGDNPTYTDLEIRKKLVLSGSQLQNMALPYSLFIYTYTFSVDAGDGSGWNVIADPIYDQHDPNYETLWLYKSVCEEYRTALSGATTNAIKIKDGDSSIDTTAGFKGYESLLESDASACTAFKTLWTQLLYSQAGAGSGNTGGNKRILANFGSDYINRPEVFNTCGGIDRT